MKMSSFLDDIEEYIYKEELIYRSLLVSKNVEESNMLKDDLQNRDYSVTLYDNTLQIDWNNIENRIVIVSYADFKCFMDYLETFNGGILKASYNFIAFSYMLEDSILQNLHNYYMFITKNNTCKTIILDKNYKKNVTDV
jgi:hypothetical protein